MTYNIGLIPPREMGEAGDVLTVKADDGQISELGYSRHPEVIRCTTSYATTAGGALSIACTSMAFTFVSTGKYLIDGVFMVKTSLETVGLQLAFDTTAAVSYVIVAGVTQLANTGTFNMLYGSGVKTYVGMLSALPARDVEYPLLVKGILIADGTHSGKATLRIKCEDATTSKVTLCANSTMSVKRVV